MPPLCFLGQCHSGMHSSSSLVFLRSEWFGLSLTISELFSLAPDINPTTSPKGRTSSNENELSRDFMVTEIRTMFTNCVTLDLYNAEHSDLHSQGHLNISQGEVRSLSSGLGLPFSLPHFIFPSCSFNPCLDFCRSFKDTDAFSHLLIGLCEEPWSLF